MTSGIDRRRFTFGSAGLIASANALAAADNSDTPLEANVLRVLFESAETGFDPAQVSDLYSNRVNAHIFESLLGYDPLAVPVRLVPLTAEAMPEVSADFTVWTVRLRRGILLRRRPGIQGPAARARRGGLRVFVQAHLRPGLQEPGVHLARRGRHPRPRRDPGARAARQEAVRLRQRRRRSARARPLHAAVQARQAAPALRDDARLEHVRGGRARGGRGLSRRPDGASRSAPGRIASSRGGAARASFWKRTRSIATCATTASPIRAMSRRRPGRSASTAGACRSTTASRSPSSRRTSRAG